MAGKPSHDTLIHCEACGEDYSATYRRCPFCGARNDPRRTSGRDDPKSSSRYIPTPPPAREQRDGQEDLDDTYIFDGQDAFDEEPEGEYYAPRSKGGKRLAPKSGGSFDLPPVNWPRLITFLCSLVIIVAALIIVFTYIYPKLHKNPDVKPSAPGEISAAPSQAVSATAPAVPTESVTPSEPVVPSESVESSAPVASTPSVTGTSATIVNADGGLRVRSGPGTTYGLVASLVNGSPIKVIASAENGWYNISFSGHGGATMTGYIMGDYISTISGGGTTTTTTPVPTNTQTPNGTGGGPTVGRTGTIVNAASGLRVRSGPSTSHEILESLVNGNLVTVLSDAGGGWYKISYVGRGGAAMTGYIMGEYISTN